MALYNILVNQHSEITATKITKPLKSFRNIKIIIHINN